MARGDAAWARRADGHVELAAASAPIAAAVDAYEEAWREGGGELEAGWKLLRALWFAGEFASTDDAGAQSRFERGIDVSKQAMGALDARSADGDADDLEPEAFAAAFAPSDHDDVARVVFWSAIVWGAWSRSGGLLATVREGVAGRLQRYALASYALDPSVDEGGAQRLLATLHAQLPRVPFLTGWVDRDRAVVWAQRALDVAPEHPGSRLTMAVVILDTGIEGRRDEVRSLLESVAGLEPREGAVLEDLSIRESARERLQSVSAD